MFRILLNYHLFCFYIYIFFIDRWTWKVSTPQVKVNTKSSWILYFIVFHFSKFCWNCVVSLWLPLVLLFFAAQVVGLLFLQASLLLDMVMIHTWQHDILRWYFLSTGISNGAIAGMSVGAVAGASTITIALYFGLWRRKKLADATLLPLASDQGQYFPYSSSTLFLRY